MTQALHRWAAADPDRISTVYGPRSRTYAETLDRVARLAAGLRNSGVDTGDRLSLIHI